MGTQNALDRARQLARRAADDRRASGAVFGALLAFRALQGLCMPGLLTVGVPYVAETFAPRLGARAMGYYVSCPRRRRCDRPGRGASLTDAVGWRWAMGGLALLPAAAAAFGIAPDAARGPARPARSGALAPSARRILVSVRAAVVGSAFFFIFIGTFTYVATGSRRPPFAYGTVAGARLFGSGCSASRRRSSGRVADRVRLAAGRRRLGDRSPSPGC